MQHFKEPNGNYDKVAFGDSKPTNGKYPIKYNEPCETDLCPNNLGQRCADCKFIGKGAFNK